LDNCLANNLKKSQKEDGEKKIYYYFYVLFVRKFFRGIKKMFKKLKKSKQRNYLYIQQKWNKTFLFRLLLHFYDDSINFYLIFWK
jgi:hypothetical protein